jgi:hypothetical protein
VDVVCSEYGMKRIRMTRRPPVVAEHPLQRQIADVLPLEIAPPGKVSRGGMVCGGAWITPAIRALRPVLASGGALS